MIARNSAIAATAMGRPVSRGAARTVAGAAVPAAGPESAVGIG